MIDPGADSALDDRTSKRPRILEAAYWLALAGFLFSVYNKSATALNNIGLFLPLLLWPLRYRFLPGTRPYLLDPLLWRALGFVALLGLSCLWSPDPLESLSFFRREIAVIAIVGLTLAEAGHDSRTLKRWCVVLAISAAWMAGHELRDWWISWKAAGNLLPPYGRLRDYGYGIVFCLPFVFALRELSGPRIRIVLEALLFVLAVLCVATGARGTWFAFAAVTLGSGLLLGTARIALAALIVALSAAVLFTWLEPGNTVTTNVARGVDSSYRRMGAWVPAAEMMAEKPALGFGYGKFVYDEEYDARKPAHPEWELPRSLGPHSLFFEVGFAAGLAGLAAYVLLCAGFVRRAWSLSVGEAGWRRSIARALLISFAGQYLVYGFIESISWHPLAVHLGLLLALTAGSSIRHPTS
jgi:O-antigen ligase